MGTGSDGSPTSTQAGQPQGGADGYDVRGNWSAYKKFTQANPDICGQVSLDLDHYAVQSSITALSSDAQTLSVEVDNVAGIPAGVFGSSPLGAELLQHATTAHKRLQGAVSLLSSAMENYSSAVKDARAAYLDADDTNSQRMVNLRNAVNTQLDAGNQAASTPTATAPAAPAGDGGADPGGGADPAGTGDPVTQNQCTVTSSATSTSTPNGASPFLDPTLGPNLNQPNALNLYVQKLGLPGSTGGQ